MKILMLTPYLPFPPSSGGQIRSYNLIKQLSQKHQLTLCSLIKSEQERQHIDKLKPYCQKIYVFKRPEKPFALSNILRTGFSTLPLLVVRNFSAEEKKTLPKIIEERNFDIIHAETFYVSPHIPATKIPIVLVDQTIEYQVYQHFVDHFWFFLLRPLLYLDVLKIKYWETFYWKKAARVIAVSEKDAQIMQQLVRGLKVTVVPNGVGEDLMEDVPLHFSKTILFIGNYAWLQNVEAAALLSQKIFPLILKQVPDARLVIAGQNTDRINLQGDQISQINLSDDDTVGIQRAYRESGILVAPLHGPGGTRLKILAAMAARLPVVTTNVGIAGIGKHGQSFLQGETDSQLANLAVQLLTDLKLYKRIANNARKLIEENYSYQVIADKLSTVYQEVVSEKLNY